MLQPFIRNGAYIQPFVGVMSQIERMRNVVEAGNVAALGGKVWLCAGNLQLPAAELWPGTHP